MTRTERSAKAAETLEIFHRGCYISAENTIECRSIFDTEFVSESQLEAMKIPDSNFTPDYEVVNESVNDTVLRLGKCSVLNFASAKNPGGGFLNGAVAQEECLAASSDLYNSQLQAQEYYNTNRNCKTLLYTHNMIYSSNITFIRDGKLNLVEAPVHANVITSPAVNAGAYYRNEKGTKDTVLKVMEKRMRYILKLFAAKGDKKIILGAYGCGVFGNDTKDVADIFFRLLKDEAFERHFEHISFAVYDRAGNQYNIFRHKFISESR